MTREGVRLTFRRKVTLFLGIWFWFLRLRRRLRTEPLPLIVKQLQLGRSSRHDRLGPRQLSGIVRRSLRLGPRSRRCLPGSLVLYRLLTEQGQRAEVVIGIPTEASSPHAHAWVEVDGIDLGPAPTRRSHDELARYG